MHDRGESSKHARERHGKMVQKDEDLQGTPPPPHLTSIMPMHDRGQVRKHALKRHNMVVQSVPAVVSSKK